MIGGEAAIPVEVNLTTGPPGSADGNVLTLHMYTYLTNSTSQAMLISFLYLMFPLFSLEQME